MQSVSRSEPTEQRHRRIHIDRQLSCSARRETSPAVTDAANEERARR